MTNFYLDFYEDFDDYIDVPEYVETFYDDGVDDRDYEVTGCDPTEYEDVPF